jgi:oligoendopeptidase F
MFATLTQDPTSFAGWPWAQIEPYYRDLAGRPLSAGSVAEFLTDWTWVSERVSETQVRLRVATTQNTTDQEAELQYHHFLEEIFPAAQAAEQRLKAYLLASGLAPEGFALPLRKIAADAAIFREANLPLLAEEQKLIIRHNKILGAQTVPWDGRELTLPQLRPFYQHADRSVRERAWRLAAERQQADYDAIADLWRQLLALRHRIAANATAGDYRAFKWQQLHRFDYTPADCSSFHEAIAQVVVPAARRTYERRRRRLGVETLRPWDLAADPLGRPPLAPFREGAELQSGAAAIFHRVDPRLGGYFDIMIHEALLDLTNRKHKGPGGYCATFAAVKRPFILMNAVGLHGDVQTLLHEAGHAFHVFERNALPYLQQRLVGSEFGEVASMSMELLASPYLAASEGGFYSEADAARAHVEHLEKILLFWPYMAVVDGFQHWVYQHPDEAADPRRCDSAWTVLWARFMPGVDWSGLEPQMAAGWQHKHHIHTVPFYYVEYGLAQLGAVQVWGNALRDQGAAVAQYRRALARGGTASFPDLYAEAGARFAFDPATLERGIGLIEGIHARLDPD